MSTFCAAAAPTHHPPGEARAASVAISPPTTRVAQVAAPSGYLGGAAARGSTTTSPTEEPLSPLSCHDHTTGDAPTPTSPTTSAMCCPKRIRRHQATRDSTPRRGREPFATGELPRHWSPPVAKGSRPPQRLHPACTCQIAGSARLAYPIKDEPINFWTFGPGRARPGPKVQKRTLVATRQRSARRQESTLSHDL